MSLNAISYMRLVRLHVVDQSSHIGDAKWVREMLEHHVTTQHAFATSTRLINIIIT